MTGRGMGFCAGYDPPGGGNPICGSHCPVGSQGPGDRALGVNIGRKAANVSSMAL